MICIFRSIFKNLILIWNRLYIECIKLCLQLNFSTLTSLRHRTTFKIERCDWQMRFMNSYLRHIIDENPCTLQTSTDTMLAPSSPFLGARSSISISIKNYHLLNSCLCFNFFHCFLI